MVLNISNNEYQKGKGAQYNPKNEFLKGEYVQEHAESIDDWETKIDKTEYFLDDSKSLVNKVTSPDIPIAYSVNPYQGCEHGCVYCYARPTHQYWGYSAGSDFESKIIVKHKAPQLLREMFSKKSWQPQVVSLSGNTDCYQPAERKYKITRQLLEVCLDYRNPVGIITKNALVLRDLDILQELHRYNLITVYTSITSTNEKLRMQLEPRTSTYKQRFKTLEILSKYGIPTGVMNAPIIPGINDESIHDVLKQASEAGVKIAGYTLVRLNGPNVSIFRDWLHKTFPDRADKVWHKIEECHGGSVSDSRFGTRMKGEGNIADIINQQFKLYVQKFHLNEMQITLSTKHFRRLKPGQLSLF